MRKMMECGRENYQKQFEFKPENNSNILKTET